MQDVGGVADSRYEVRLTDVLRLAVIGRAAKDYRSERIVVDPLLRIGGVGGDRIGLGGRAEAAREPAPGEALGIQQIADVLAGQLDRFLFCDRAAVVPVCNATGVAEPARSAVTVGFVGPTKNVSAMLDVWTVSVS
jgi:hypothetical protein